LISSIHARSDTLHHSFLVGYEFSERLRRSFYGSFSLTTVELLATHRDLPEVNPFLPLAKSKHDFPVKSELYRAGIFRAEEPPES